MSRSQGCRMARRAMVGGAIGALVGAAAAAAPVALASPDATLLDLVRAIEGAKREADRAYDAIAELSHADRRHDALQRESDEAEDRLRLMVLDACDIPARSERGWVAKARLFQCLNIHQLPDGGVDKEADILIQVAQSMATDMTGTAPPLGS